MSDEDSEEYISKSERKRIAHEVQALGVRLVELTAKQLRQIDMPPELEDAVMQAREMPSRGARKRQLQFIGKIMRNIDIEPIQTALARIDDSHHGNVVAFHAMEQMRDRLIEDMNSAMTELVEEFPSVDRQHIRQLVRNAQTELKKDKPPKSKRLLFQYLKQIMSESE